MPQKRVLARCYAVLVAPMGGIEPRVDAGCYLKNLANGYPKWQDAVQTHNQQREVLDGMLEIEVRKLLAGVHARIGAAATSGFDGLPQHLRERAVENGLHRCAILLNLPAAKISSVVG